MSEASIARHAALALSSSVPGAPGLIGRTSSVASLTSDGDGGEHDPQGDWSRAGVGTAEGASAGEASNSPPEPPSGLSDKSAHVPPPSSGQTAEATVAGSGSGGAYPNGLGGGEAVGGGEMPLPLALGHGQGSLDEGIASEGTMPNDGGTNRVAEPCQPSECPLLCFRRLVL